MGVGFDTDDDQIRITQAEDFRVFMGSDDSHRVLQNLCCKIKSRVEESGRTFSDFSPQELAEFIEKIC
jgi:hypothetical protein